MSQTLTSPFRLIALDLDGTLTNSDKVITPHTFEVLMRAQAAGVRLVLCSGRPTYGIAALARQLKLEENGGFVLSCNGANIIDWTTGDLLFRQPLEARFLPQLLELADAHELPLLTYRGDCILATRNDSPYLDEEARINQMPVEVVTDFIAEASRLEGGAPKCLIPGDPELLVELEEKMKTIFGDALSISRSAPFFLEIMAPGVGKDHSLARLLAQLDLSREQLIAFGDGFNDLTMLRFAGMGVAMANAAEEVKAVADFVTLSNDEDGVGHAVEQWVLNA